MSDAKHIAEAIGPQIRETFRAELREQTEELKSHIRRHDTDMRDLIREHEVKTDRRLVPLEENQSQLRGVWAVLVIIGGCLGGIAGIVTAIVGVFEWLAKK